MSKKYQVLMESRSIPFGSLWGWPSSCWYVGFNWLWLARTYAWVVNHMPSMLDLGTTKVTATVLGIRTL